MSNPERTITVVSLINSAVFYAIIIVVFLVSRKSRLNKALATMKADWLAIITLIALPLVITGSAWLPAWGRTFLWATQSVTAWWVLYEVYQANWDRGLWSFLCTVGCEARKLPKRLYCGITRRCRVTLEGK